MSIKQVRASWVIPSSPVPRRNCCAIVLQPSSSALKLWRRYRRSACGYCSSSRGLQSGTVAVKGMTA